MKSQAPLRKLLAAGLCCWAPVVTATVSQTSGDVELRPLSRAELASARVPFIRNEGQIPQPDVRFYAQTFAGTLFVTVKNELVYTLPPRNRKSTWAFRESFTNAKPGQSSGDQRSGVGVSHFKGSDPRQWRTSLETFDTVDLGALYPGIRVKLRAAGDSVEKLFFVSPGGTVSAISIAIDGVESIAIDPDQRLVLTTSLGEIVFTAPEAYQFVDGTRRSVEVTYVLIDDERYGFRVGEYDRSRDLVIDPMLASTYLGGHNPAPPGNYDDDIIWGMVATGGDVFVGGATQSPDFPIHLGYDDTLENSYPDGFITRMSGDLSTIYASTYIGTDGFDRVADLAMDEAGTIVAVGQAGYGFPVTEGAYNWQGTTPTGGGFVARFSADLSTLMASAVPTPSDYPTTMALGNGGIYFGGSTNYREFPITPGAYRSTCCPSGSFGIPEYDGFAGKLSLDLSTLQTMTYLGGNTASAMAVGPDGSVFITDGFDYAVTGYIARFDDGLTARTAYLSYYPGSESGSSRTYFNDVVAANGYVIAVGQTYMNDLPATAGVFDTTCGTDGLCDGVGDLLVPRSDGFVAIYSADLLTTAALTYLGGSHHESIRSVAVGLDGGIHVTGETTSVDFPIGGNDVDVDCGTDGLCNAADPNTPKSDGFVVRLSADLAQLDFGTYLGGSGADWPTVIALNDIGLVYTAGFTESTDFPTSEGAFDGTYNGGTSDAFLSSFDTEVGGAGIPMFSDGFELGDMSAWTITIP